MKKLKLKFVIDTNVIISALIKDSFTREVLLYSGFDFYYPEISFREIKKHLKLILKKSGLSKKNFDNLISILFKKIKIVPMSFFEKFLNKSAKIMKNIDIDDAVFIALASALQIPIWSDDSHFDFQRDIDNFKTHEIAKRFLKGV